MDKHEETAELEAVQAESAGTLAPARIAVHSDFREFRWTKPARQMVVFLVLMFTGIGMSAVQHNYDYLGFYCVMIVGASGPFIYLYRTTQRELLDWGAGATAVYERTTPVPVHIVLFDLVENRLRVVDVKVEDREGGRVLACRLMLGSGKHRPAFAEEILAQARIDEAEKIAIVDVDGYRMWCKVLSIEPFV